MQRRDFLTTILGAAAASGFKATAAVKEAAPEAASLNSIMATMTIDRGLWKSSCQLLAASRNFAKEQNQDTVTSLYAGLHYFGSSVNNFRDSYRRSPVWETQVKNAVKGFMAEVNKNITAGANKDPMFYMTTRISQKIMDCLLQIEDKPLVR